MASLFNQQISQTYQGLLKTTGNGVLTSSLAQITDGSGNGSKLYLSTSKINFYNEYEFPTTDGSANQILKTDGSGTLSWVADASGDVIKTGTITLNTIAVWNNTSDQLRSDPAMSIVSNAISLLQKNNAGTDTTSYNIGGGNIVNVTGSSNCGFGFGNMQRVTTGANNVAFGNNVLDKLTIGQSNVGVGQSALFELTEGEDNTAIGFDSLKNVTTGDKNTAIGQESGITLSSGSSNTFIGTDSGRITTGSNNTFLGNSSGSAISTGSKNVIIGSFTGNFGGIDISGSSNNIIISDGDGNVRLQVDSSGNVGIGATPTDYYSGADNLVVKQASGEGGITIVTADNTNGALYFAQGTTGNEPYRGGIYYDHANDKLHLTTVGTSRLNISSVGVSTFTNGTSSELLELKTSRTDANYGIMLYHSDSTLYGRMGGTGSSILSDASLGELVIRAEVSNLVFSTANIRRMTIKSSDGSVGIGTTQVLSKLNVKNDSSGSITRGLGLYNNAHTASGTGISLDFYVNAGDNDRCARIISTQSTAGNYADLQFQTSNNAAPSTKLTISSGGDANFSNHIYSQSTLLTTDGVSTNYRWQTYNNASDDAYVINSRNKGDVFKIGYTTGNIGINRDPHSDYKVYMMGDSTTSAKYIFVTLNSDGYGVLHARNDGAVYAGLIATDSGTDLVLNSSGFICKKSSSIRYKKDVEKIDIGLDFILSLNPVKYNLKSNDQKQVGFIAEDFPDERFVSYSQVDTKDESKGIQKEAVNYSQLTAVLTKAIQEQQTIIEDLKLRIEKLEK